jgi:GMP synthase (glutamine-hydrolysing)
VTLVDAPADNFKVIAVSGDLIAGIQHELKPWYGLQFHPEVDLTTNGNEIFSNFLFKISKLSATFTTENREDEAIEYIRRRVGNGSVLVLVSGGVDSTVAAALVTNALGGDRVYALHIDNGLMRHNETAQVKSALEKIGLNLICIDATKDFLNGTTNINGVETKPLCEVTDPETKRKIIGDTFMKVSQKELDTLHIPVDSVFLVQGTLRPDLIESASSTITSNADVIKTHHNDTELVRKLRDLGRVIEPLSSYHKDEVRELGESLGLSKELVWRHPFPGPGLGIRILCTDKPYMTDEFDNINEALQKSVVNDHFNVTLLPVRSVGVQGDGRTYSYVAGISQKNSDSQPDWKLLFKMAKEIPKQFHKINRIVFVFGDELAGPITEITPTYLEKEAINQLRHADLIVNTVLRENNLLTAFSQVPVVLVPVPFGIKGNRSIALRPFITNDFMTGIPGVPGTHIPEKILNEIVGRILAEVPEISRVMYDLTAKPPGTTEWE